MDTANGRTERDGSQTGFIANRRRESQSQCVQRMTLEFKTGRPWHPRCKLVSSCCKNTSLECKQGNRFQKRLHSRWWHWRGSTTRWLIWLGFTEEQQQSKNFTERFSWKPKSHSRQNRTTHRVSLHAKQSLDKTSLFLRGCRIFRAAKVSRTKLLCIAWNISLAWLETQQRHSHRVNGVLNVLGSRYQSIFPVANSTIWQKHRHVSYWS